MTETRTNQLITKSEREAFAWLWRTYLRQRLPLILVVAGLVFLQSSISVGFLHLLRTSLSNFLSVNNGIYELMPDTPDGDGDGVYQVLVGIDGAQVQVPVSLDIKQSQTSFDPIALLDAQGLTASDASLTLGGIDAGAFTFIPGQTGLGIAWIAAGMGLLMIGRAFASYSAARLSSWVATNATLTIRSDLLANLMRLDMAYFDSVAPGRLVNRIFGMVSSIESFFTSMLVNNVNQLLTVIFVLAYLAWVHLGLFVFITLILPLSILGIRLVTGRIREYAAQTNTITANFLTSVENTLTGMRTIKLTNQGARALARLVGYSQDLRHLQYASARNQAIVSPFVDLLAAFFMMAIVGLGGWAVINNVGGITATTLLTFVIGLALIFDPARMLSRFQSSLSGLLVNLREVYDMNQERPQIIDSIEARTDFDASADLIFDGVDFAYQGEGERPLFSDLNMRFLGGKTSAIVGQTGSGKSTILALVARLYEPQNGNIFIGDQNIRDLDSGALRDAFGVVSQDIFIFDGTVMDNIRFVRPEASEEDVLAAAQRAQLADLIEEKGQQTVGPRGGQLSGGQRQRIAIARAFLQDAPIVLLDEATSALDQKTETKITEALKTLCQGRTTLIIAHRLSTITHADAIFVLEAGNVAEHGTHQELMDQSGLYAALYAAQAKGVRTQTRTNTTRRWWQWGASA